MYRFLLTPRWLGINLLALVAVPVCIWLGLWQISRYELHSHHSGAKAAASSEAAVSVEPLLAKPAQAADQGRKVTVRGVYDAAHQLLVPDRTADGTAKGARGYYVLTPLRTASGVYVPVVRGWAAGDAPAAAPSAPSGMVTVEARLEPAENQDSAQAITTGSLPAGQLGMISATTLVNALPYQVWNGWLAADRAEGGLAPVVLSPSSGSSGGGLNLRAAQNLGYIGEWFVFAGFVVFMWFRLFRREVEQARDAALGL